MKRLLLVGGGHAHVQVLDHIARTRPAGLEVSLVTPYERQLYSGMLPAWVAGHTTRLDELAIPLAPLATRAGARLHLAEVTAIDLAANRAHTDRGAVLGFDHVSIAVGSHTAVETIAGALNYAVPVRPIELFVETWQQLYFAILSHPSASTSVSVVGGGPAGVELALAIAWRVRTLGEAVRVQLVTGGSLLPNLNPRARALAVEALAAARIRTVAHAALRIERGLIALDDGSSLASDISLLATGAAPPTWLQATGLATDAAGFITVNPYLQSVSHPQVFAAGDCMSLTDAPRPRSGVYAVRAGPPLARNLIAAARGEPLVPWTPQRRALYLLAEGAPRAIGVWGPLAFEGGWVWRWKRWIDHRFLRRFGATRFESA